MLARGAPRSEICDTLRFDFTGATIRARYFTALPPERLAPSTSKTTGQSHSTAGSPVGGVGRLPQVPDRLFTHGFPVSCRISSTC